MSAFVWDERYVTGQPQVDDEHMGLVALINQLVDLHSNAADGALIEKVLTQLIEYTKTHFRNEENLMEQAGCDPVFVARHKSVHQSFAREVGRMLAAPGNHTDTDHLLQFLTHWLAYHILGMDQSMARQIQKIEHGTPAAQAYAEEQDGSAASGTSSLLDAMHSLYRIIGSRNDALIELNQNLEKQVAVRTQELTSANTQLKHEQLQLQIAMRQVEMTQKKLLESEHRRAEGTKRNLERFLGQIIDGDPVPTLVIDAQHRVTHWNKACAAISGLSAEEMIGTDHQWRAFYHQPRPILADLIVNGSMEQEFATYYQSGFRRSRVVADAFESEAFFAHMGDTGRWLFFTAAPLRDAEGKIIGAIETLQDVTERHRAEEELLKYQSQLEQQVADRTHDLARANQQLAAEQKELTQLLEKVEEAQQQLLQSEKMAAIGQLAAGVAHEINNPIGFVNSNLGTLKNYIGNLLNLLDVYEQQALDAPSAELAGARQQADLEFMREDLPVLMQESQEGLERVRRIVQDLKDFSRVDQAERQSANLNEALESTLNVVRNEIKYKAEVVRELGDIPMVDCIPAQINQVFMNLLVNAAQAIEHKGTITVRSGQEREFVWFDIEDSGKGMPAEVRKRIFEPFYTTKPVGQGTGLGLSISYDIIVKKHGGRIDVDSQPAIGTRFRIWLPIHGKTGDQAVTSTT